MARPTKHKANLTKVVPFRLSPTEFSSFQEKVIQSGMTSSEFLRECVLTNRTTVIAKTKASLEKKRMQFIFNKAGNNINQIAHSLHTANLSGKLSDAFYQSALQSLSDLSKYLRSALNHVD